MTAIRICMATYCSLFHCSSREHGKAPAPTRVPWTIHEGRVASEGKGGERLQCQGLSVKSGGERLQCQGLSVKFGGERLQCGGLSVKTAGERLQCGGLSVKTGGERLQCGWLSVKTGGERLQCGGLSVKTGGFKVFKVLLSFWPLGARKRSYIRTRHSLWTSTCVLLINNYHTLYIKINAQTQIKVVINM